MHRFTIHTLYGCRNWRHAFEPSGRQKDRGAPARHTPGIDYPPGVDPVTAFHRNAAPWLMIILSALILSACATTEKEQPQSASVRAAKACMKSLRQFVPAEPEYYIGACTNTGVWVVEYRNKDTGEKIAEYDFVNKLYGGMETGGGLVSVESRRRS